MIHKNPPKCNQNPKSPDCKVVYSIPANVDKFVAAGSGGLDDPWGLAFDAEGYLYVSDTARNEIMKCDQSGRPVGSASNATWAHTLSEPYGLVWHNSTLYVASFNGVEIFDTSGNSLGYYGHASSNPPPLISRVVLAHDLAFEEGGRMYVSVVWPHKIFTYIAPNGAFSSEVSTLNAGLQNVNGLLWNQTSGILLAAGDDPGRVVRLSDPTPGTHTHTHHSHTPKFVQGVSRL